MKILEYSEMENLNGGGLREVVGIVDGVCAVGGIAFFFVAPYAGAFCAGWGAGRYLSSL